MNTIDSCVLGLITDTQKSRTALIAAMGIVFRRGNTENPVYNLLKPRQFRAVIASGVPFSGFQDAGLLGASFLPANCACGGEECGGGGGSDS